MKWNHPKISEQLITMTLEECIYEEEPFLQNCKIVGSRVDGETIERLNLTNAVVKNCSFQHAVLPDFFITDVRFENCDFSNADVTGVSIHRASFHNCKMLGVNFADARLTDVLFDECIGNLSAFVHNKWERIHFLKCQLQETDFFNCKMKNTRFEECSLDQASFDETPLKKVEINTSEFDSLTVSMKDLSGCIVSTRQAIQFASMIGLDIRDE
ncbi:pentapeptide repeat-containing protein [Sporosarcina sp. PTS2304]|uniref:pentapeptide repeat-containing protein n=1 Tax=Sporosarcina sp. PTS2304 TaxID=2283194 RepID=UPI000E0D0364|nr:pentapeptide repeat-containing protein [Sporosarcina sp. PTS2304]AXI00120.1 pentapeptide repeat-containing protein [Sporosarcina sp. PTS2304]